MLAIKSMRFREPACERMRRNMTSTHMAQGLKPSTKPRTLESAGREYADTSLVPRKGTETRRGGRAGRRHVVLSSEHPDSPKEPTTRTVPRDKTSSGERFGVPAFSSRSFWRIVPVVSGVPNPGTSVSPISVIGVARESPPRCASAFHCEAAGSCVISKNCKLREGFSFLSSVRNCFSLAQCAQSSREKIYNATRGFSGGESVSPETIDGRERGKSKRKTPKKRENRIGKRRDCFVIYFCSLEYISRNDRIKSNLA